MTAPIAKRPPMQFFRLVTDQWTKPFWDAAADARLVAPRCADCGTFRMPPTPFCPTCQSQRLDWVELSGDGTVYSYSIVTRALIPGTEDALPYITAVIALAGAGGARLISNIVDVPIDGVRIGDAVRVVWDDEASGIAVPRFVLLEAP
jgi:uncharacterized OB-fold protein